MKLQTFTIYDSVHQQYFQPHHFENEGLSLRQFADLANEETTIAKNPQDYSLWHIGSFETTTGELTPSEPVCIAKAHEHVLQFKHDKKTANSK
jgi:hypothetical protein